MVGLLDIADVGQSDQANIRGEQVEVRGLSVTMIAKLLTRFDTLQQLMDGRTLNALELVKLAPDAVSGIIAYGTGFDDQADPLRFQLAEQKASTFTAGEQLEFITKIFGVTFGDKSNPFVARVAKYVADKADRVNDGMAQQSRSQWPSKASLRSATTPEMFGRIHHCNSPRTPS
jgi:hypothetical protein